MAMKASGGEKKRLVSNITLQKLASKFDNSIFLTRLFTFCCNNLQITMFSTFCLSHTRERRSP